LSEFGVAEVVGAFSGRESFERTADASPEAIDGTLFGFSDECFEFGEGLLDGRSQPEAPLSEA
jgi:hypothetical protein